MYIKKEAKGETHAKGINIPAEIRIKNVHITRTFLLTIPRRSGVRQERFFVRLIVMIAGGGARMSRGQKENDFGRISLLNDLVSPCNSSFPHVLQRDHDGFRIEH